MSTNKTDPKYNFPSQRRKSANKNRSFDMQRPRHNTFQHNNPRRFTQDQGNYFDNMNPSNFGGMQHNVSNFGNHNQGMMDQPNYNNPTNRKFLFNFF